MPDTIETTAAALSAAAHDAGDKRAERALDKALFHYLNGVRPVPTTGGYLIPSATTAGQVYRISDRAGCNCTAATEGNVICWHSALVEIITVADDALAEQRAALDETLGDLMEYAH